MKNLILSLALIVITVFSSANLFANNNATPANVEYKPVKLSGPRIGLTFVSTSDESINNYLNDNPFITQFGYQFERRFFTLENGNTGIVEFVGLVGGMERNLFFPSLTMLVGFRAADGFEFGLGPNVSASGASFALAGGFNIERDGINFPINFSIVPTSNSNYNDKRGINGVRLSVLAGFNGAKRKSK